MDLKNSKAKRAQTKKKQKNNSAQTRIWLQLIVVAVILIAIIVLCAYFSTGGAFSYVKEMYSGNGEYNAFWENIDDEDDSYPIPETEKAVVELPFEYHDYFGDVEYSPISIMIRESDGLVITENDADRRYFPASITKIMTAIIVCENVPDLSVKITLDDDIFVYCSEQNAAIAGFSSGESVTALDLMYGMLLPSGAECALGLARYVAGSEEAFAVLMNEKAQELGMTSTNFVTCTGLHDLNHYSTARDLAVMVRYAIGIDTIRKIMSTNSYCSVDGSYHQNGLWLVSSTLRAFNKAGLYMGNVIGGKTGFTDNALLCLASFGEMKIDGEKQVFILITLGAGDGGSEIPYHAYDCNNVFNSVVPYVEEETEE